MHDGRKNRQPRYELDIEDMKRKQKRKVFITNYGIMTQNQGRCLEITKGPFQQLYKIKSDRNIPLQMEK